MSCRCHASYNSKDAKKEKTFDVLEWFVEDPDFGGAAMTSHVPNKGKQMVRYYGYYSNVSRGKRKKGDRDELIPSILEPDGSSKACRKKRGRGGHKGKHGAATDP